MILGQYNEKLTYEKTLTHPVWEKALTWIQENRDTLPDGEHEIQGRDIYANIHTVETFPESEGFFEAHKEYIDIHYCLSDGEHIQHSPIGILEEEKAYDTEKDYQLYIPTELSSTAIMRPDSFAIFFPGELHMPKISDGKNKTVRKVVIKIRKNLFL